MLIPPWSAFDSLFEGINQDILMSQVDTPVEPGLCWLISCLQLDASILSVTKASRICIEHERICRIHKMEEYVEYRTCFEILLISKSALFEYKLIAANCTYDLIFRYPQKPNSHQNNYTTSSIHS